MSERKKSLISWLDFLTLFFIIIFFASPRLSNQTSRSEYSGQGVVVFEYFKWTEREKNCLLWGGKNDSEEKQRNTNFETSFWCFLHTRRGVVQPFFFVLFREKFETFHPLFVLLSGYNNSSSISDVIWPFLQQRQHQQVKKKNFKIIQTSETGSRRLEQKKRQQKNSSDCRRKFFINTSSKNLRN